MKLSSEFILVKVFLLLISIHYTLAAGKYIFASKTSCDRYSLDALYYEKFEPVTEDIFADVTEFVNRVSHLVSESLIAVMAAIPGRDSSDREEQNVHHNFKELRRRFAKEVDKMRKNVTTHWEELLANNYALLLDKENSTLESVRNGVSSVAEVYKSARNALDASIGKAILPVKIIVANGLRSIVETAKAKLSKEQNDTSEQRTRNPEANEEELRRIVMNITSEIVPSFLGKVTLKVFERRVDLDKKEKLSPEDRDSALDDLLFDLVMMKARVSSLADEDLPKTEEHRDLARRNIYMFWSDSAVFMYSEKKKKGGRAATSVDRRKKYQEIWSNEDDLADTLINLMQTYS